MGEQVSREIHLVSRPDGLPTAENFSLIEVSVPAPTEGQVLIKNLYMSIDPAMRPPLSNGQARLNEPLGGGAIGKIIESQADSLPVGSYVLHRGGFREYCVADATGLERIEVESEPLTTHLHVLGTTGLTAYGGLLVTGELKDGENVFVSAAAGAVGSVVGQIAKIKGCRVA
ncbi:MAG: NADP-dependent oxidoreductase, partial [Pseudomonadales bacterium]|nr:NADP-dependent oxidoreductase [Pseudomonadales bacterium]